MQSGGLRVELKYQMQPSVQCRASRNVKRWDGLPLPHETVDTARLCVCEREKGQFVCEVAWVQVCVACTKVKKYMCKQSGSISSANLLK